MRKQYSAMRNSGVTPDSKKHVKNRVLIYISDPLGEEWDACIWFLKQNTGAPWKSIANICLNADVSSGA